ELSASLVSALELAVGAMLLAIGVWTLSGLVHRPSSVTDRPAQGHSHPHGPRQGSAWVGAAHGLAGTAGVVTLLPVAFISSPWLAGGYLLAFGLGTVVSMGLYALVAGLLFHRAGMRSPALGKGLRLIASLASICVGVLWMVAAVD
ncbi:MAG: hypothetical protein KY464_14855, partial [Gemmatimonadetes bacterium]|nr:hypothetical protein [Gemmatimonadota bacterium]